MKPFLWVCPPIQNTPRSSYLPQIFFISLFLFYFLFPSFSGTYAIQLNPTLLYIYLSVEGLLLFKFFGWRFSCFVQVFVWIIFQLLDFLLFVWGSSSVVRFFCCCGYIIFGCVSRLLWFIFCRGIFFFFGAFSVVFFLLDFSNIV